MLAVPILKGRLKGLRYAPGSGGKVLRVLLGTYEPEQTAAFQRLLRPGQTLFDVGAHVGYYAMLSSVLLGPRGQVHAFEPEPRNALYLKGHVSLNRLANVAVVESAVGGREGEARLAAGTGTGTGRLAAEGRPVAVTTLDAYARRTGVEPDHLKIDVEGAEAQVLEGARELLARRRPTIFLSTHGEGLNRSCRETLSRLGYRLQPLLDDEAELVCLPA